jgi:hypothetical protein
MNLDQIHQKIQTKVFRGQKGDHHFLIQLALNVFLVGFPLWLFPFPNPIVVFELFFVGYVVYSILLLNGKITSVAFFGMGALAILTLSTLKLYQGEQSPMAITAIRFLFMMAFFAFLSYRLLVDTFKTGISKRLLYICVSNYFTLGILFSYAIQLLQLLQPGSFSIPGHFGYDFVYASFIYLTSTGLGDFLPLNPPAKALTVMISLSGQLYLTFFVAIIIGKFLNNNALNK